MIEEELLVKLSIIVPVYNMEADGKLEYCLDSLVNQSITDYEIVAIDDCSTDNSLKILRNYEENYSDKIRIIASPINKKQGGAKNIGLQAATGEWIGFVDSDDWITPNMYEQLLEKAEEVGADMVACDYQFVKSHSMECGKVMHQHKDDQTGDLDYEKYASLILDSGSLVVKIYKRKQLIEQCPLFPEGIFYEDNAVSTAYILQAKKFAYIREPYYYYYQHDTSTVHTITRSRCEDRMKAARFMLNHAKEQGYFSLYEKEIEQKFVETFYINTLFSYVRSTERRSVAFMCSMGKELQNTFPNFQNNPYYQERMDKEQKKMIRVQLCSSLAYVLYYDLLSRYRKMRYGKKGE
ncbi:MAG: glycosyltransferase family 2 protein [Eubacteriales bacterium]